MTSASSVSPQLPSVAVLTTTRNEGASIAETLVHLDSWLKGASWGLFVADNGSTDATLERARLACVSASPVVIVGFPVADSHDVQLDRLVRLASPWADRFEYAVVCDLRSLRPGPIRHLLAAVRQHRQSVAVGDSEWS